MKKTKTAIPKKSANDSATDKILGKLGDIEHRLKVMDEKNISTERSLLLEIHTSAFKTQQQIEKTLRAEIQVANHELEERLEQKLFAMEKRLFERISNVADQVTKYFGKKFDNHERRIRKVEHHHAAA